MTPAFDLWVYLSSTPLLWLTVTLIVWAGADRIAIASGRHPAVNPVLISIIILGAVLILTGTSFATYFQGAQFVHFLLGPAIVAIAVPLYRNLDRVRENTLPMIAALVAGSVTAVVSALSVAAIFGVPEPVLVSLAPKSVTAGVAMGIAEQFGGQPALTAVLVVTTGLIGAIIVTPLMNVLGLKDYAARGFAAGLAAHGIGTARAFVVDEVAGTFAGIAMALNAVLTALILPLILYWFLT
jgi:predicted murein hydrolase (TIGR00659 family)